MSESSKSFLLRLNTSSVPGTESSICSPPSLFLGGNVGGCSETQKIIHNFRNMHLLVSLIPFFNQSHKSMRCYLTHICMTMSWTQIHHVKACCLRIQSKCLNRCWLFFQLSENSVMTYFIHHASRSRLVLVMLWRLFDPLNTLRPRQNGRHFADDTFKRIFLMKMLEFWLNFTEVCSQRSNKQYSSIGSGNGLAPTRRQAINWTNGG